MMQECTPIEASPADPSDAPAASEHAEHIHAMTPDELVRAYTGLVKSTGQDMVHQLNCPTDLEDLLGWGYQGLLEAHKRFDPAMEVSFASFAFYRIRGAMYDGLRATGWAVRGTAIQVRDTIAVNDYLESNMLAHAGVPPSQSFADCVKYLDRMVGDCVTICLVDHAHLELVSDSQEATQRMSCERGELGAALNAAVSRLSEDERAVLVRYHVFEDSMVEIADDMGYSKSWVSRINARAIDKVKRFLFEEGDQWELYMTRV